MVPEESPVDWSNDLLDTLWFQIGTYLTIHDIHRLARTCSRLHTTFTSNDFWSFLIRRRFGQRLWHRFVKDSSDDSTGLLVYRHDNACRSKLIYCKLLQRHCVSFADTDRWTFDRNRIYRTIVDGTSLNGHVLCINDSIQFCYSLRIETVFENILPGRYDVIWRLKLHLPYVLGETEFVAMTNEPGEGASTRWQQEDFLSMYRCFNCDFTQTDLWFYQTMGTVEIHGREPCHVYVAMINEDFAHRKHGVFLDYVELKLRLD